MSNPSRTLHNRLLPPFNKNQINYIYANNESYMNRGVNQLKYDVPTRNDKYYEDSIILYLLDNPDFVESFLVNNYSPKKLQAILYKMSTKIGDNDGGQRKSEFHTRLSFTNKDRKSESNVFTFQRPSSNYRRTHGIPSTISYTSSNSLDMCQRAEQLRGSNSSVTLIRFSSNETEEDNRETKVSSRLMSLQEMPMWSQRLLLSHKDVYLSWESDVSPMPQSKKQLLEYISSDIFSMMSCDGGNLYLVDEANQTIHLNNNMGPNESKIICGTTFAAFVASERRGINTKEVFADDRFPQGIPTSNSLIEAAMAQPIIMNNEELVGVIEIFRHSGKAQFSTEEEQIFKNYCMWASIAVFYNEMYILNRKQRKLNKFLLNVTQKMFGKFQTIDAIIKDIMASAKNLVQADRVSLFLIDMSSKELYSRIFDRGNFKECIFEVNVNAIKIKIGEGIAGIVAATGETLNITDAYVDERFNRGIDVITGYVTKTVLCMPVKLNDQIIGVVQMLNKKEGYFTALDERDFQIFATYCGVALHIAKMYEKRLRSHQKYKVALEVLSYHSCYTVDELVELKRRSLPSNIVNLDKFSFWPWSVSVNDQPVYVIYMFRDLFEFELSELIDKDSIGFSDVPHYFDEETIMKFVLTVKRNYRAVPYHNWSHAFSVAHSMYVLLKAGNHKFDLYESLALFIGCLCHDLDHRGKTNQFMVQSSTALSGLYSTSTMEHHHFNMTVTILQREGHNIFRHLSSNNYRKVLGHIKHCILATDLTKYFEYRVKLESDEQYLNADLESNRLIHMALSMTLCDLCSMYKAWEMQLSLVMIIMSEFWTQGDEERSRGRTPMKMLDRDFKLDLPDCQVGFLRDVCLPCYRSVGKINPAAACVLEPAECNLLRWQQLAALPEKEKSQKITELELFTDEFIKKNQLNFK